MTGWIRDCEIYNWLQQQKKYRANSMTCYWWKANNLSFWIWYLIYETYKYHFYISMPVFLKPNKSTLKSLLIKKNFKNPLNFKIIKAFIANQRVFIWLPYFLSHMLIHVKFEKLTSIKRCFQSWRNISIICTKNILFVITFSRVFWIFIWK